MRPFVALSDRKILRVAGDGAAHLLQGLCTQDLALLRPGGPGTAAASSARPAAPAAFLSSRGRVLCDVLLVPAAAPAAAASASSPTSSSSAATPAPPSAYFIDCHASVSYPLLGLLLRHRLRAPLDIVDVSSKFRAVAALPPAALGQPGLGLCPSSKFFPDPRSPALGHRAILPADQAEALIQGAGASAGLSAYHLWRLCCAVPEGPTDFPRDTVFPFHGNLDLLNFVSFDKGCYAGQELVARTKYQGAVRRRVFSVVATADDRPQAFLDSLHLEKSAPLDATVVQSAGGGRSSLLLKRAGAPVVEQKDSNDRFLWRRRGAQGWTRAGVLQSSVENMGLCILRCDGTFDEAKSFDRAPLSADTELVTAGGVRLGVRAPPYVFAAVE